jgi:hypothetical protein
MTAPRARETLPDGRVYECEPIKGKPGAFTVLWVHVCPECKYEAISPTEAEFHDDRCSRNRVTRTIA